MDKSHKIKACFRKLHELMMENNEHLRAVFETFDSENKDNLSPGEFRDMIKELNHGNSYISEDEIAEGFRIIDEDSSNTIEYEELEKYYCKINGLAYQPTPSVEPVKK